MEKTKQKITKGFMIALFSIFKCMYDAVGVRQL